jgi:hypothetical protein
MNEMDSDRFNGELQGRHLGNEMIDRVRDVLPADSRGADPIAAEYEGKLQALVEATPSAGWAAGLREGWAGAFATLAYLHALRTVQDAPWAPVDDPTRHRHEDGARACATVLRQIRHLVRPTEQTLGSWSPRQLGDMLLDALHGGPEYASGFAEALGLWLGWEAQGIFSNPEFFDPVREIAMNGAPTDGESEL